MNKQANRQPGGLNSKGNIWTQEAFRAVRVCVWGGLLSKGATQVLCGPRKPTVSLRFLVASIKYMP